MTDSLTKGEHETFNLLFQGYTNQEIADIRCVSIKTVEACVNKILDKLSCKGNSRKAIYIGLQTGILSI